MRYYISDLHFFHDNLNHRMDNRGFQSMEEMHEYMIEKWNGRVRKKDEVVILGDFSIGKGAQTNEILERLNGKLYLIKGNHDRFLRDKAFHREYFKWIEDYHELNDNGRKIILSHYPVFCYNGQYQFNKSGIPKTYMLYGHVHNTFDEILVNEFIRKTRNTRRILGSNDGEREVDIPCQMINCFCMFSDYVPLSLDEWIEVDRARREKMDECER